MACPVPTTNPDAITVAQFRSILPSFADSSIYLDENIQFWINIVSANLDPTRWSNMLPVGQALYIAHQLTLERQAIMAGMRGGVGGASFGLLSSKSINGASVSYDTGNIAMADGGDYNLTIYGIRFLKLCRQIGAGPLQITPSDWNLWPLAGSGWPGPLISN